MSAHSNDTRRIIIVLIVLNLGCGSPTAPMTDRVQVTGVVRDSRSDAAVAGARVSIGTATATTDANGFYALSLSPFFQSVVIDGEAIADLVTTDPTYLGNYYVHNRGCVGRYGTVVDKRTRRPVPGVSVSNGFTAAATDQSGWFRLDFGCPDTACIGFNTTFIILKHPNYIDGSFIAGRGVCGVLRVDYEIDHK